MKLISRSWCNFSSLTNSWARWC